MELSAEGVTPEYMALAAIKFKLSLPQLKENPQLKEQLLQGIKANNMAPYYKEVCADLGWPFDQKLYDEMAKENQEKLSKFQEDDSETPVWQDRLDYLCSIGDKEVATALATAKYEDSTLTTNRRLDAIFALFRIAYFHGCNVKDMGKAVTKAHELVDKGGDWRSRNKLKAYEAIYCLAVRDYSRAADLFIDCVSTFESYELVDFGTIIQYCVLACALALERHALQAALRRQGAAVQALRSRFPELRELVESLHECRYADFMKSLAWVETQICVDPVFRPHYQHYVREARIKAYVQLLRAYRSLSLDNIADTFGVTREFVEEEISTFTAAGRLQCRIDAVAGCVVTGAGRGADADRSQLYQATIREGDLLLNRVKKLASVINF
ncbi:26S proteasome non-ATPase regulatory subunit 6 [Danaus plexippus]|uniref:26S proteasome non-ATPase regulatory subunit 6 n=1 Tax=Danaus plexippus TaxID=13037 RepID=UPI002AB30097|nr:26S proteasome non-ATPase regulatory subunit 6 [Danaus plexippus]